MEKFMRRRERLFRARFVPWCALVILYMTVDPVRGQFVRPLDPKNPAMRGAAPVSKALERRENEPRESSATPRASFGQIRPTSVRDEKPALLPQPGNPLFPVGRKGSTDALPSDIKNPMVGKGTSLELNLTPPRGPALFQPQSEAEFLDRLQANAAAKNYRLMIPQSASFEAKAATREIPAETVFVPAQAEVCHPPLQFSNDRVERYGIFHPFLQPGLSTARFWWDTLWFPRRALHHNEWECGNGY